MSNWTQPIGFRPAAPGVPEAPEIHPADEQQTRELLSELLRLRDSRCAGCAAPLCSHQTLMSLVAGCQDQPRCLACLARLMGGERDAVRDHLLAYIRIRACRRAGWEWANAQEHHPPGRLPSCLWPAPETAGAGAQDVQPVNPHAEQEPRADAAWDAGPLGCGELVMGLRQRLLALPPGSILKLTATDAGMPEDLPAWCGLTGHTMARGNHPYYWIRRREN